jgi:hypothetical protein
MIDADPDLDERHWRQDGRVWQCPVCAGTSPTSDHVERDGWRALPRCERGHQRRKMMLVPMPTALQRIRDRVA